MRYNEIKTLEKYLCEVEKVLLEKESYLVDYPKEAINLWNANLIDEANKDLLKSVSKVANIYALFTAEKDSEEFSLKYIGKTTKKLARQRIRNHLIKKDERTGSKLKKIIEHVKLGGTVKISWVSIEPESLRNYVEEEIINKHSEAEWNRENK